MRILTLGTLLTGDTSRFDDTTDTLKSASLVVTTVSQVQRIKMARQLISSPRNGTQLPAAVTKARGFSRESPW